MPLICVLVYTISPVGIITCLKSVVSPNNRDPVKYQYFFHMWQPIIVVCIRLVPAQDGPFFYTRYHLSALQNCALLFSANFQFIFIFKNALHNLFIELWSALFFKNIAQLFINFTRSFVAIELLTFCKNAKKLFYCSRELSLFWPNK